MIRKTEIIPKGWVNIEFGEIISSLGYGPRFSGNDYHEDGNVKTIRGTDINSNGEIIYDQVPIAKLDHELINAHKLEIGDLVMITTADCGITGVFKAEDYPYIPSAYAVKIGLNKKACPDYFKFFVQTDTIKRQVRMFIRKGTVANLPGSDIKFFNFNLPPLQEQQKIASILSKWDELIDAQTKLIEAKEKQKTSLMQKLLTGEVRFPGFEEKWTTVKIGDIFHVGRGGSPRPIDKFITESPDGLNWIKIGDTKGVDKFIYSTKQKIKKSGLSKTVKVEVDDFILSNSMSYGRPYIMKTDGCIHDGWLLLRRKIECSIDFMYYLLGSDVLQKQYLKKAAGSAVKNLNKEIVSNVKVSIPNAEEQIKIAQTLSAIDIEVKSLNDKLEVIKLQKKGLMQQLLTGKIRVKV